MNGSILNEIKKMLGLTEEYQHFDQDIIIHINTALSTLIQIGLPANKNFVLVNAEQTWSDYITQKSESHDDSPIRLALKKMTNTTDNCNIGMIKSYVYMKTKLVFDPPQNSFAIDSIKAMLSEYESRINIEYDKTT